MNVLEKYKGTTKENDLLCNSFEGISRRRLKKGISCGIHVIRIPRKELSS